VAKTESGAGWSKSGNRPTDAADTTRQSSFELPTIAYKKGVRMLFLYITVAKCPKAAKPLQPLIEFAFLRIRYV
jgi:hypothetical protein